MKRWFNIGNFSPWSLDRSTGLSSVELKEPPSALSERTPRLFRDELSSEDSRFLYRRRQMVDSQLRARGITDAKVLKALENVPRHRFVLPSDYQNAYQDSPLPIGHGQTISQPYIVALMTQLAVPERKSRVLDVGTGSGYQAAILAELVDRVYSVEIVPELAREARERLHDLGYEHVEVRLGDGYRGWPDAAPFDVILVAAAPNHVPQPLIEQLAPGGKLVIPVGRFYQQLMVIEKRRDGGVFRRIVAPVSFVPMTGEAQKKGRVNP